MGSEMCIRDRLEVSKCGARQGLRSGTRQGSSWVESEQMLRARVGSSVGERACARARQKSAGQAQAGASGPPPRTAHPGSMPSLVAQAKRALVAALKSVARTYGVRVDLTGDSPDAAVRSAYRRVFLRAHPDMGGSVEHAQRLSGAKGAWDAAQRASTGGRPVGAATTDLAPAVPRKAFRIQGKGALLTYFLVVDGRVRPGLEVTTCGPRQGLHSGRRQGSSWIESEHILRGHMGSLGGGEGVRRSA